MYKRWYVPFHQSFVHSSSDPTIITIPSFFTEEECDNIISKSTKFTSGSVASNTNNTRKDIKDQSVRECQVAWFDPKRALFAKELRERVAKILGVSPETGENIQVAKYDPGGFFVPHFDSFDENLMKVYGNVGGFGPTGQRIYTAIIYLNTCVGGSTIFPELGIKIPPEKGKLLLFNLVDGNNKMLPSHLHEGAKVLEGQKWICTLWFREGFR